MSATERSQGGSLLSVDHDLCSGVGYCQKIAPEVFRLSDGQAWLADDLDLAAADHDRLRRAEADCPWLAITFTPNEDD
ncbi:ferredoxin [Streptomyces ipomoeae]|uniref:ferredoxin n=1 Tax=Streptomyces ipomoeae TaxID=103232 RepID=UPI0011468AF9|nr:ferredoxin [Streptomyces ipomoeae]MDX2934463.1 ferredoxin [Streptomyces ipomoeae]TQE17408.1 ferredoxin [Streptomyces ipomoeae]